MPSFSVAAFALAGVAAAAAPIIIHLMNRRRFRTVDWAAMQFLREAVRQSRRVLHLRDLLLLLLRTACVLLFGLAMARPYFTSTSGSYGAGEPVHAVVLVDNSLSMGYRSLAGTTLEEARGLARRFIEALPAGSRTAVIPVCSDPRHYSLDPAANKQDALDSLREVTLVDRAASFDAALDLGRAALARLPDLPNKRFVFIGDGQRTNFPAAGLGSRLAPDADAPRDVQLVALSPENGENAWVAELRAVEGAAVPGADCEFVAVVRYEGPARRAGVQIDFRIDGKLIQSRVVDLEPNQRREIAFAHRFDTATPSTDAAAQDRYAVASVELADDRLPDDNRRDSVVPIVPGLQVLYVTERGPTEPTAEAKAGRGLWIQRLLAPVVDRADVAPKLVRINHVAVAAVEPRLLTEARLVVVAGVRAPGPLVPLLRSYVEQGGQLLIAAGDDFDPAEWHDGAWLDGAGILPAPPAAKTVDIRRDSPPKPLRLDLRTLGHRYFQIEGASTDELSELYSGPLFFEAVAAEPTPEAIQKLLAGATARIVKRRSAKEAPPQAAASATGAQTALATASPTGPRLRLTWPEPAADHDHELRPEQLAERETPIVVGRLDNGLPLLIERRIERGTVVFCSTSLQGDWNTLALSRAVVVLDRLARSLLERTLPRRNFDTAEPALVAMRPPASGTYLQLLRPGDRSEPLTVDALGDDKYAVVLRDLAERGVYRIVARETEPGAAQSNPSGNASDVAEKTLWEIPLAVAGPPTESQLEAMKRDDALAGVDTAQVRWLGRREEIGVAGAGVSGQYLWKWLMVAVLVGLLVELALIRWLRPTITLKPAASPEERAA